jgi:hypothetical protein
MEFDPKRAGILKRCKIAHLAIVIVVVLIFLQWFMPYFKYAPWDDKDLKQQTSMWGEIFFNFNFMQLEDYMKEDAEYKVSPPYSEEMPFKFISLRQLGAPVLVMVCGIIILATMGKKGIAINVIPLIASIVGIKGWFFGNLIPRWCNVAASKYIGGALMIILLLCTIANIVFCIQEMKSRPADYYLPSLN